MRPASLLAVVVSAILGAVCGVGGGLALDRHRDGSFSDPLALGIHLENQSCTDGTLVVVATGDSAPALATAVAQDPHLRYLDTRHSCATAWAEQGPTPRYAAFLGPFASRQEACATRMTAEHRGDFVTRLHDGDAKPVRCVCYEPASAMPVLRSGLEASVLDGIWVRAMQRVLTDLGYLAKGHMSSFYDQPTVAAVEQFQSESGLRANGVVGPATWAALVTRGCKLYAS
ncbi:peptidoglycan-binding domain-containing protein [Nocardioides cynanchi]|uniref:peptidoglycan-binding domain-containing protein n=1 Tax=Nocardioides cynanchi TaxID=2558918 RepID=UPI001244D8DF|nr:peptidoglycan-binding domain-containing protein [Nocardioides cynanchi]